MAIHPLYLQSADIAEARQAIAQDFSDFKIESIRLEKQGMDNHTFRVNDVWIFRFPKDGGYRFDFEIKILELLKGKLELPIPEIKYIGKSYRYMGYRRIGGEILGGNWPKLSDGGKQRICDQLAKFLWDIHRAVPKEQLASLDFSGKPVWWKEPAEIKETIQKNYRSEAWAEFALACIGRYEKYLTQKAWVRLLHRDVHGENLVIDPETETVSGVFDFGDVAVSDLHQDFYPFIWISYEAMDQLASAYEKVSGNQLDRRRIKDYRALDRMFDLGGGDIPDEQSSADLTQMYEMHQAGKW